ncbi:MAG: glycosyl transferase family 2, partial [Selenomonas sp.]|nr:glycosyl transferase family 2 [Selenomonas sp.]
AAVGAACGGTLSPEQQSALAMLLPRSCTEVLAAPEAQRMLRRVARLAEVRQ